MSASAANTFLTTTSEPLNMPCCPDCSCMQSCYCTPSLPGSSIALRGHSPSHACPTAILSCSGQINSLGWTAVLTTSCFMKDVTEDLALFAIFE